MSERQHRPWSYLCTLLPLLCACRRLTHLSLLQSGPTCLWLCPPPTVIASAASAVSTCLQPHRRARVRAPAAVMLLHKLRRIAAEGRGGSSCGPSASTSGGAAPVSMVEGCALRSSRILAAPLPGHTAVLKSRPALCAQVQLRRQGVGQPRGGHAMWRGERAGERGRRLRHGPPQRVLRLPAGSHPGGRRRGAAAAGGRLLCCRWRAAPRAAAPAWLPLAVPVWECARGVPQQVSSRLHVRWRAAAEPPPSGTKR